MNEYDPWKFILIVNNIPSCSKSGSVKFWFSWSDLTYCSYIGWFYVFWFFLVEGEPYDARACMCFHQCDIRPSSLNIDSVHIVASFLLGNCTTVFPCILAVDVVSFWLHLDFIISGVYTYVIVFTLMIFGFFCYLHWKNCTCNFSCGYIINTLGYWAGVIPVCAGDFHFGFSGGLFLVFWYHVGLCLLCGLSGCTYFHFWCLYFSWCTCWNFTGYCFFYWLHLFDILCVFINNRHPHRFCMVGCFISIWELLYDGLVRFWIYHPQRYFWGGYIVKYPG